jgi:membrane protease subunit HflK
MSERDVSPRNVNLPFKPRTIVIVLVVLALVAGALSSFYMVDQSEQAVVLTFGKFSRITGPGLNMKAPFGIEKNYNVPTQIIQTMPFGYRTERPGIETVYSSGDYPEESLMLTGDLNIIDVQWAIQYRIVDPRAWLFNVEYKDQTIRDISQSVLNLLVGDRTILSVLGSERSNISQQAQTLMNKNFDLYGLGIQVTTVQLKNIVPPKGEVQDAFEDVNKAEQDMERLINEGLEEYNREIPKARGQAAQAIQVAEGYAAERVNQARGDVARFLSVYDEYKEAKEATRSRLYIEMMEDIFSDPQGTDLIDRGLDNFLPLKNLQGGTQ